MRRPKNERPYEYNVLYVFRENLIYELLLQGEQYLHDLPTFSSSRSSGD